MWTEDYRWHFDYVRLAWDTGFCFEKHKYPNLDKNKICIVDVDRVVKERDVASIERFIPTIVHYILESDQAEVLDTNFVKMFKMSQLSVEYLLFCKKYLDNTVVLLKQELKKLKEENKELKLFTQELETHISTLTKHSNLVTTFKCDKCSKVFSTEEYLYSHAKRRHTEESKGSTNTETDVLQSEIKELKERLNVTEKLLQEKEEKSKTEAVIDENKIKVEEIQNKFEEFKEKVENDLKILQIQKNFYEDKYSKLFDILMQTNNKENISSNTAPHILQPKQNNNHSIESIVDKIENTTQTDEENKDVLEMHMETMQNKNIYNFEDTNVDLENISKKENIENTIEQKILRFEEDVESKISSSLNNIQSQMEAFWGRLSEFELKREKMLIAEQNHLNVFQQVSEPTLKVATPQHISPHPDTGQVAKPEIKPRMKLSKPNKISKENKANVEEIKRELEKMYSINQDSLSIIKEQKSKIIVPERSSSIIYNSSITSEPESDTKSSSTIAEKIIPKQSCRSNPPTLIITKSSKTRNSIQNTHSPNNIRKKIDETINDRLQEMGISPNWQGIPQKTFEKALAIVEHQANLTKKIFPDYDNIKKSIEKSLKTKDLNKGLDKKSKTNVSPNIQQPNVINIRYRRVPKPKPESEPQTQKIAIKNRSLYEDSESDSIQINHAPSISHPLPAYSDVIEELKTTHNKSADTDSDLTSLILPKDDIIDDKSEPPTKSVLKSYPSIGSLTKKKVLFDIETDVSNSLQAKKLDQDGDNLEVTSLVLDTRTISKKENVRDKKDNSLSDFDLSEY